MRSSLQCALDRDEQLTKLDLQRDQGADSSSVRYGMCTIKAYNTVYDIRNVYSTVYDIVSYAKHVLYKRSEDLSRARIVLFFYSGDAFCIYSGRCLGSLVFLASLYLCWAFSAVLINNFISVFRSRAYYDLTIHCEIYGS